MAGADGEGEERNGPVAEAGVEVVVDPLGYRRLEPIPSDDELSRFYESQYYDALRRGGRGAVIRRLLEGGSDADRERTWLEATLYADIDAALRGAGLGAGARVLDVGCGTGELVGWLAERGYRAEGLEPSEEAAGIAAERGLEVSAADLEGFCAEPERLGRYDAVVMVNVLEHLADPQAALLRSRELLGAGGVLFAQVPNDFNPLQLAAREKLGLDPWWVAVPDHINYFDTESLPGLLGELGFTTLEVSADFPMEAFLLAGFDYISEPELGARCHGARRELELSMPPELRRRLATELAAHGVGRQCRVLARAGAADPDEAHRTATARPGPAWGAGPTCPPALEPDGRSYVPLRAADIEPIRGFRNAQIEVLRQAEPIEAERQRAWYAKTVLPTHAEPAPAFLLVSVLDPSGELIGYGGLTNIDWDARRAEVSFLADPRRAAADATYGDDFGRFLHFLSGWAFEGLGLNRLFTETYAFRAFHLSVLEQAGFQREGVLRAHAVGPDGPVDSLIHGLLAEGAGAE